MALSSTRSIILPVLALRKWCVVVLVLATVCLPPVLAPVITEQREYHGKKVMCVYGGLVGAAKSCGTRNHARVFTGTVMSAVEKGDTDKVLDIMPDEVFLGDASEVKAITNQACLHTEIHPGDRWLFYLDRNPQSKELVLSYGGPSKPTTSAADEISMLRALVHLPDGGLFTGTVHLFPHAPGGQSVPLANHDLVARNVKTRHSYTSTTDERGHFLFELPAGSYQVAAALRHGLQELKIFSTFPGLPDSEPLSSISVGKGECWEGEYFVNGSTGSNNSNRSPTASVLPIDQDRINVVHSRHYSGENR